MKTLRYHFLICTIIILFPCIFSAQERFVPQMKKEVLEAIEGRRQLLINVSDKIWEYAEIALLEVKSSALLENILEDEGFQVERDVAGLPTAFVATYGSGRPIVGILAEYDALPGLSQDCKPYKKVLVEGGAGHGCGHNLFGAGSLGAALGLKEVMGKYSIQGTLRLYGCPAEEDVGGKLYMAREGFFDDLDVCFAWHPACKNRVDVEGSQAVDDMAVEFFGKTAHAAFDPWMGNSALDAVEMMTFGINLLREHVKPTVRIHYVITDGGRIPNIVPEHAKIWIWVRDSNRAGVKAVVSKVEKIVEGAALATGTTSKIQYIGSYHEMLENVKGAQIMQKNLEMIGPISYTEEEKAYARRIQKEAGVEEKGMSTEIQDLREPPQDPEGGSTDVAEVSWIAPTVNFSAACAPLGVPWHSWAVVASGRHPIGYKGLILAAKVMAATAFDLLFDQEALEAINKEFKEKKNGYVYKSGIPPGQNPPLRTKKEHKD